MVRRKGTFKSKSREYAPKFDPGDGKKGDLYEKWKKKVSMWCELTSLSNKEKGPALYEALEGRAENAALLIETDLIKSENGMTLLLEKLDELFMPDKFERTFWPYKEYKVIRKQHGESVRDFIIRFDQCYLRYERVNTQRLSDMSLAYDLLVSCNLSDRDTLLVRATLGEDYTYNGMKTVLKRMFDSEKIKPNEDDIIEEQVLFTKDPTTVPTATVSPATEAPTTEVDTLYAAGASRPQRGGRGRGRGRGGRSRGGFRYSNNDRRYQPFDRSGNNGLNPMGRDGKPTTCTVCRSIYHYVRECPNASKGRYFNDNDNDRNYHHIKFSMFVGCTSNQENAKLLHLVNESSGRAVLDSGCTNTVCGPVWLANFIDNLSKQEREMIKYEPSNQTFTFGDGDSVTSMRKVTIPCWMGGEPGEVTTDVVDCNIPLLLSNKSMEAVGIILDFRKREVKVNNRWIKLERTTSGHYALPISL